MSDAHLIAVQIERLVAILDRTLETHSLTEQAMSAATDAILDFNGRLTALERRLKDE